MPHPVIALSGCSYITAMENIKRAERPLYFPLSGGKLLRLKIGITHLQIYIEKHPGRKKIPKNNEEAIVDIQDSVQTPLNLITKMLSLKILTISPPPQPLPYPSPIPHQLPWKFREIGIHFLGQTGVSTSLSEVAGSEYFRPTTEDNSCRTAVGLCRLLSPPKFRTRALYFDSMLLKNRYSASSAAKPEPPAGGPAPGSGHIPGFDIFWTKS